MLKIRALNRELSSDDDTPIRREAQEEIALEEYNNALRFQTVDKFNEAEKILLSLLNDNLPQLENNGGLPSSMLSLKYSCYVNLATISTKKGNLQNALENYLQAANLDGTDVRLWHKIGNLAVEQNKFRQAAYAFSKGLECSERHWPCLDQLISVLYAMKDTVECLTFIGKALILDPHYMKGLVLQRQIYQFNPAIIAYYQKHNPNYIWEPPYDVNINIDEEKQILEKEQILCDKIIEIEKSLGLKSLQTILLPKAIEDFTWISFGKAAMELHEYISHNKMSHFTMVDLTKSMSENDNDEQEKEPSLETFLETAVKQSTEKVPEKENEKEKDIIELNILTQRRQSQNSETNNEVPENMSIQTDNDEEQVMEQDGDDLDDNNDKTDKTKTSNKSNKRKRDLLSDLQIWGWHSKRKSAKKGKCDKDFTVEDALNRIIPQVLLRNKIGEEHNNQFEDTMSNTDSYTMYVSQQSVSANSPIFVTEEYFATNREKEDIQQIWKGPRGYWDSVVLIREFVINLSKLWHFKWPKELIQIYVDAYIMYREHFDHPDYFSDILSTEVKEDALATLLYGELLNFSCPKIDKTIHVTSLAFLQAICGWEELWKDELLSFFLRVYWLRAHIFKKEGHYELAIGALEMESIVEEEKSKASKFCLKLPNCFEFGVIDLDVVLTIVKHLDMVTSLNCIEELYNKENYQEVADILKSTFTSSNYVNGGKMNRPAQLAMLLHSLWYIDLTECFFWTEECLFEALTYFLKPTRDRDTEKWEKIVEKCLALFQEIIRMETVGVIDSLNEEKRARLVESLCKIVRKQLNTENISKIPLGCVTPWILLHYILLREEHRQQASKRVSHVKVDKEDENVCEKAENQNGDIPPSIAILFSAHEFLGPKGWCLTGNGELLHFIVDTILDRLDTPIFEPLREKIDIHIEQSLFCLYQHPSKKNKVSRHLADHNVDPLPLNWERAFQLYDFYGPDCLPEFNSYKNASISSDLEQLLQRIIALVPSSMDPQPHMLKLQDYIQGKSTELPDPIQFSNKVRAIYYLIGDFYFKQREFTRCIKYFMMDLCINPNRGDSWACLGLSYLSQLENKLNYCKKLKSEMEFLDKAKCAQICFRKALELEKDHVMLWIEFGSFEYMVHSFCSRIMKSESDALSMERFEYLENQKNCYLENSGQSFEKAIHLYQADESEPDERWLQYYILGKIAEKKQKEPQVYLKLYFTASKLLHENNATYPEKINYYSPQHLSVEALELHYRIHASILKYLELHEGKEISNSLGNLFKEYLEKSYFPKKPLAKQNGSRPNDSRKVKIEQVSKEVKDCLNDLITKVVNLTKTEKEVNTSKDEGTDVIMISDSDDENKTNLDVNNKKGQDVQEFLDKMMEETMKNTEEQEPDSDTSLSKNVVEVKMDDVKPFRVGTMKSESETETDIRTSIDETSSSPSSSSSLSSSSDSDSDDDSSSSSSSSSEATNENMSSSEILTLIDRCIVGLEQCVIRLPQNYKALYRLAHLYFNYKSKKDLGKSKQLLLGEYNCKGGVTINGLFSDRKPHNFFHGIWRIPSSEIDRPGSLSAHMSRCITLLLQILRATNDNKLLLDLSVQFRKTPDPDKIYIKDSERLQFADQSMEMCLQVLRSQLQNIDKMTDFAIQRLLQEIFRSYQRVQKHETNKEPTFAFMLIEAYKKLKKGKISENVNVLDLATKFCQQNRIDKQKRQIVNPVSREPGVVNASVLPTSSTTISTIQPPLKRPGLGRPRGRPPLPKLSGQQKPPRPRNPNIATNPYSWQKSLIEQNATYNYLKHYQEELIKQYSQSLSLNQLTQLTQYFTQTQLANALAQTSFNSQCLPGQNSLMNPKVLKQMSTGQFTSQLPEAGKNEFKKKDVSNLSLDALRTLGGLDQSSTFSSHKKSLLQTVTAGAEMANKAKLPLPSSMFNAAPSAPVRSSNNPHSSKAVITHSVTSVTSQDPAKLLFTTSPALYKSAHAGSYRTNDIMKVNKQPGSAITTTTSSTQLFKEPMMSKAHGNIQHSAMDETANILMKDRPNISITPVLQTTVPLITTSSFLSTPQTTLSGKTLQEKLADKQKQHSTKQLAKNLDVMGRPVTKKDLNTSNMPLSLAVTKNSSYKLPTDSGISISQVPVVTQTTKTVEALNLKGLHESQKIPTSSAFHYLPKVGPTNNPEKKSSDDDVIIIE